MLRANRLARLRSYRPAAERLEDRCLLNAGALDPSFGTGGIVQTPGPAAVTAVSEVVQPDGKIVTVSDGDQVVLSRYNADGSLDNTFGTNGQALTGLDLPTTGNEVLALQADGKIVVTGGPAGTPNGFVVGRFLPNGAHDPSFGTGGFAIVTALPGAQAGAVAVQPDGKIVLGGSTAGTTGSIDVARLNPNGSLDTTFGTGGATAVPLEHSSNYHVVTGLVLQPDGRIVISGSQGDFNTLSFLMRFTTTGQLDPTFGNGGKAFPLGPGGGNNRFNTLALQPDGKIVAAGGSNNFSNDFSGQFFTVSFWSVGRFNPDGSKDASFGTGGFVMQTFGNTSQTSASAVYGLVIQPDGKIVAAGNDNPSGTASVFTVARYNPDGTLDPSFGTAGTVTTPVGTSAIGLDAAPQGNGIVVAGSSGNNVVLARYLVGLPPPLHPNQKIFVTGADAGGGPDVKVFDALTNQALGSFFAFDQNFTGGVRVAVGDVNGDTFPDIITAAGPGGGPNIIVFSGKDGSQLMNFFAYDQHFTGGTFVAAGDVNGDGFADIICGADKGGGPNVTVFSGKDGSRLLSFFPYDQGFTGGVRVAAGVLTGTPNQAAQIITGAGPGGGPNVTTYLFDQGQARVLSSYFAFNQGFTAGIYVASGHVTGNPQAADVIVGAGPGGGPNVAVFGGPFPIQTSSFFPYNTAFTGGVRVGAAATLTDQADVLSVPGPGGGPDVKRSNGLTGATLDEFFAYNPNFTGGLYVAGNA